MDKIVFLCTGNTCRSPMAEGFWRVLGGEEKTGLAASSAGLFTADGMPASAGALTAARERGAELSAHRSRQVTKEIAEDAKYLVCMTGAHCDRLEELFPACKDKIYALAQRDIDDPFGGGIEVYRTAAAQIYDAVAALIARMEARP